MKAALATIAVLAGACASSSEEKKKSQPGETSATTIDDASPADDALAAWIADLNDPARAALAITELQRLGDPRAIEPLTLAWRKNNQPARILRVIIDLARSEEHGGPHWKAALPALIEAVDDVDVGDSRSIDNAVVAADALGHSGEAAAVEPLLRAASRRMPKLSPGQRVRLAAIRSLGMIGAAEAVEPLAAILATDADDQPIQVHGAAADALARIGDARALPALVDALYTKPPIHQFVRRGIVAVGPEAIPVMRQVLRREHPEVEKLAEEHHFDTDCDVKMGPRTTCVAPSQVVFKAAAVLGDLRATEAVGELTALLDSEPAPAFYSPDGAPGPSQHLAVIGALRLIGDPAAAPALRAVYEDTSRDEQIRAMAADAYSMLATTPELAPALAKVARKKGESAVDLASLMAYSRVAAADEHVEALRRWTTKAPRPLRPLYEQALARGAAGVSCAGDTGCLAGLLADDYDVKALVSAAAPLASSEADLRAAVRERAFLDLAKLGDAARGQLDALLDAAGSTDRLVREGALLALGRVAPRPCPACVERLEAIVERDRDQTILEALTADTRVFLYWIAKAK